MEKKTGEKGLMLGHFVLLLLECIVVLHGLQDDGLGTFRFYTTDSNLLCGISSALMLFFLLQRKNQEGKGVLSKALQRKGESWTFPPSLSLLRYIFSWCFWCLDRKTDLPMNFWMEQDFSATCFVPSFPFVFFSLWKRSESFLHRP